MLESLPADFDTSEGSTIYDMLSPAAIEMALAAILAQQVLERGFASTTFGAYLDFRADEHGLIRRAAVKATGTVTFTGTEGTTIPAGTRVSTASTETVPAIMFTTDAAVTIAAGQTTVNVAITAEDAGISGNVATDTIQFLAEPIAGITAVTNAAATTGGTDEENDTDLLSRYLTKVRSPSAGGNKADYVNWALEVTGVGGVSVVPVRDGPGTVSVAIISTNKEPASQTLVDSVQNYIAPPWLNEKEAETMTLGGFGTSVDNTQTDDTGDSVKMVYDANGTGTLTHTSLNTLLQQPGIWQARVRVKADSIAGANDLLQIGIWNVSAGAWAKISVSSSTDAVQTLQANDLTTAFGNIIQAFYWNGQDMIELRVTRLQADTTTIVWIDQVEYRSTFSKDTGSGKAPIGARVTVQSATAVTITVSATLIIATGYNADSVKAAARQAITDYIKSLAFSDDNDVRYVRIGQAILDTAGVQDYQNLTVNGSTANVTIGDQEVAVTGSVTLT
ncbi:baseplate J/gp47 family protein [Paenibacillus alkalitolerans]|uniref:baseplate J/gp47 family protein n=1 Tax=Paenibacillus alkalitolerans TaxID=2799335 RepID=UPI0018F52F1B|nr:baseplate J/gp47 family protein [Paenibacillus alkalitolerans]